MWDNYIMSLSIYCYIKIISLHEAQSSVLIRQSLPSYPCAQTHWYEPLVFWHVAPLRHGDETTHSSTSS